jgi:hypothetical protein
LIRQFLSSKEDPIRSKGDVKLSMKCSHLFASATLFSALAAGQAPYQNIAHEFWGAKTAFAGHSNWYMFMPKTAVPVTCSPAQSRCSASGYQFKGGEGARFYSPGTPPTGIYTIWGGSEALYGICDVQGTSFTLRENNCSGAIVTFTTSGTGQQNVLVNIGKTNYFTAATGFPAGTVLNWYSIEPGGINSRLSTVNGIPWQYDAANVALEAVIPATAAPATYNVSVRVAQDTAGSNSSTVAWQITVVPSPSPLNSPPTYVPAIPGLTQWQTTMTSANGGGLEWCSNPANPTEKFSFGNEAQVWYYDGARIYFKIASYTGNPIWNNCAHNIASQYADYVIGANGGVPGWRVFPNGLALAALHYPKETKFKQAFNLLLNHGLLTPLGGRIDDDLIRETAYAVDTYAVAHLILGYPQNANLQRSSEFLMSMLLSYTDGTSRYSMNETFCDGLAMEALIGYYQITKDSRVPYVVKRMLDNIWANYDRINHEIAYNPDPVGPHCADATLWWGLGGGDCGLHAPTFKILQNLIAGGFAWYWSISGDDTYRVEGDDLFQHTLDFPPYSGKQFSQAYRWSFYYVNTRTR